MKRITFLFVCISFLLSPVYAQNKHNIDSLRSVLKTCKEDTTRANAFINLSLEYCKNKANGDSAVLYGNKALQLSQHLDFKLGIAKSYRRLGEGYKYKQNLTAAIDNYNNAVKTDKELGLKKRLKDEYSNIGNAYKSNSQIEKAVEYYDLEKTVAIELKDSTSIMDSYNNIVKLYINASNYAKALDYSLKSLNFISKNYPFNLLIDTYFRVASIYGSIGNPEKAREYYLLSNTECDKNIKRKDYKFIKAACLVMTGTTYDPITDSSKALMYYNKAINMTDTTDKSDIMAACNVNMGNIYLSQGNYKKAKKCLFNGIKQFEYLANNTNPFYFTPFAGTHLAIAGLYNKEKDYKTAIKYVNKCIDIVKEKKLSLDVYISAYEILSKSYEGLKDYKTSLDYYRKSKELHDSIFSDENKKKMGDLQSKFDMDKKEAELKAKAKAEEDKIKAIAEVENKKQKLIIIFVCLGLLLVLVFAGFVFRSLRIRNKQNKIIVLKEKETQRQKEMVEEKQREILDSIEYALRIQTAILPPQKLVKQYLENSFILYKPKDIVAGDFYWMETVEPTTNNKQQTTILFAACDCTGHGVPGAMVSVVCHNALNRAVREFGLTQPAAILDKTAEIVIENFSKSEESIKDGMDISLASLNLETMELQWAGANNPLWIVRNNQQLEEIKADKQPIGMNEDSKPFTNHRFKVNKGDTIYLFTDGFADQFGGDNGEKKLTKKRFKEVVLSLQNQTLPEQGTALDKFINEYRKEVEQIDDILVMGVRV